MPKSVPNYVTTNVDGTISADFNGRISAQGLNLPSQHIQGFTSGPPAQVNQIIWRDSNGAQVADLYASDTLTDTFGHINQISMRSHWPGTAPNAGTESLATVVASSRNNSADIIAQARLGAGTLQQANILASDGTSDFLQLGNIQIFSNAGTTTPQFNLSRPSTLVGMVAWGTAYVGAAAQYALNVLMDNGPQAAYGEKFFNETFSHQYIIAAGRPMLSLSAGTHTLFYYFTSMTLDANDRTGALMFFR